jgi:hypothetical protein
LASPANAGITNRKIISEACTETSPLNVCGSTNCIPGRASSARKIIARRPPASMKKTVVVRYWTPITLWSVLTRR